ncbi:rhomboid-related protein 2-like protein [Leptotrombidium deliense]|uniref:rhomboid protease n=1 Tax=Leptotrombidium deliense TaxID=299467 RepID=A0A443SMF7_9ACAR|nr:rhomboid-related protein 2-like protein [Leptotrombidium deliense]
MESPRKTKTKEDNVTLQLERVSPNKSFFSELRKVLMQVWGPVFDRLDVDGDGKIPFDDLKNMITQGSMTDEIPEEVIDEIMERADWDKNRVLTFNEFLHMLHARDIGAHRPYLRKLIVAAAMVAVPSSEKQTVVNRYLDEYSCKPPPIFMICISVIEIAVFIYYCVKEGYISATGPVPIESILIYNPKRRYQFWRYITYMFIHAGFVHLFFNVLIQMLIGVPLELVHKWWRIGLVYLGGVLAGSLGASISDPNTYLAGASGGVYALIAAHVSNVIINWSEMEFNWVRLIALLVFGGTDVGVAVYDRYYGETKNRTSYAAHIAGAVGGLLIGIVILRNLRVRKWERLVGWFAFLFYVILMAFLLIWNVANPNYFPPSIHD